MTFFFVMASLRLLLVLALLTPLTLADCECGYLATITTSTSTNPIPANTTTFNTLFTDLLETDFTRLPLPPPDPSNPSAYVNPFYTTEWAPQAFNLTAERARGTYGEMFDPSNVRLAPREEGAANKKGGAGGDGVQLVVKGRGRLVDGMVPVAELDTRRLDVGVGSFRASMKVPAVAGTCAAFFWVSFRLSFFFSLGALVRVVWGGFCCPAGEDCDEGE